MADPLTVNSHQNHPGEQGPAEDHAQKGEDLAALLTRLLAEVPDKTQKDLAAEADVTYVTLNAWMNRTRGTSRVEPETLRRLADTLRRWGVDVSPADLFRSVGRRVPGPTNEEREQRLLKLYRQLPEDSQRDLVRYAEAALRLSRAPQ
ncbi:helix-turn-helix transcriptional regulator [Streptomyces sp. NPDC004658]|uniref:helix-turn-helix domain-containing protein n=1 Tax=Streptomyces sp. NPDC004658 TaxID=3154672 RepID=UPI0033B5E405